MVNVERITFEHYEPGSAVSVPSPRLSWRFEGLDTDWKQSGYTLSIKRASGTREFCVESDQSVLVPWPDTPLASREKASVQLVVTALDGKTLPAVSVNVRVAFLSSECWSARLIGAPVSDATKTKPPFRVSRSFNVDDIKDATLYATALGLYEVSINGVVVGDHVLSPGWQSYEYRLAYQVYNVTSLLRVGTNTITADVGEGWYAGRLGWAGGGRNIWGQQPGFMAALEVDEKVVVQTDNTWECSKTPIVSAEIYDGEHIDTTKGFDDKTRVEILPFPKARLHVPQAPPMRRTAEVAAVGILRSPSGKTIIDFGQNLVGWLKWAKQVDGTGQVTIRHGEVLENGELCVRPLRVCKATDRVDLGGRTQGLEPKFTFHGFRYAEIDGFPRSVELDDFVAIVVHTDFERTGTFDSSHRLLNQLHSNVVWSMRGNFLSVPMDCPQRDERLGWTGDLEAFCPAASFLFNACGTVGEWLGDVAAEQLDFGRGIPPMIVPCIFKDVYLKDNAPSFAIWGDVAVISPFDLYRSFGDLELLQTQYKSMLSWLDQGVRRSASGLWDPSNQQLGDWLDPRAPADDPGAGLTSALLVADAFLVHSTRLIAEISDLVGCPEAAIRYRAQHAQLVEAFRAEYVTPNSRIMSDTQCAYVLALAFGLEADAKQAAVWGDRLDKLVRTGCFKVGTGFAGTPLILGALAKAGKVQVAYRMLLEGQCPSWLYPVR